MTYKSQSIPCKASHQTTKNPMVDTYTIRANAPPPLPYIFYTHCKFKYNPPQCIYTYGSFIPLDKFRKCNVAGSGVQNPTNNLHIVDRLLGLQNILRAEFYAVLIALTTTRLQSHDTYILIDNLNSIYLISNRIQFPPSEHHHLDKVLIPAIVNQNPWTAHNITIQKVWAHTDVVGQRNSRPISKSRHNHDKTLLCCLVKHDQNKVERAPIHAVVKSNTSVLFSSSLFSTLFQACL